MLFNSIQFAIFFIIIYSLYLIFNHRWQNRLLLIGSYVFYGSWDWRFLSLILISTIVDYYCGIKIYEIKEQRKRKFFLFVSIFTNMAILGFFKYFDFFTLSFQGFLSYFDISIKLRYLNIILPVGISFYTFQTMSYTIDIFRKKMKPTKNFSNFALFVAFFPQLVAGPIERARHLLPQIIFPRKINLEKFFEGVHLIFWGLFLKIFIADNLAKIVDPIFTVSTSYNGFTVLLGLYAFAFQIFCDFNGYSNIARGLGKCMGFDIRVNFNCPYFAVNPRDFWRRWHISLSSWLKDYLYVPLGGNRKGAIKTYRNIGLTMLLGGLWHGAAWTFVLWGAYHGILLIVHRLCKPFLKKIVFSKNIILQKTWFIIRVIFFFHLICIGWLLFRAESITQAVEMFKALFFNFNYVYSFGTNVLIGKLLFFIFPLLIIQVFQFWKEDLLVIYKSNLAVKSAFYYMAFILMIIYGVTTVKSFIYFQF